MRKSWAHIATLLLVLAAAGCVPIPTPTPPPAAPVPTTQATTPATAATPVSALEDEAWTKVVAAAKKEGRLVIYGGGNFSGDVGSTLAREFKSRYGIEVETLILSGRTSMEKIKV